VSLMRSSVIRRVRKKTSGSIYFDVILAVFILSLSAAAFYSVFPKIGKVQDMAQERSRAMHIGNRVIDQLQMMRPQDITPANLVALQFCGNSGLNGSPYTITRLPMDDATDFSPRKSLKNGTATLTVTSIDSGSLRCVVKVQWTSESGHAETVKVGTVIGGYR